MQTIEEIEMRAWLNRALYAEKKAKALEKLSEQCKERAQGLSVNWEQNDKGKSDGSVNGTENALMRLAEINEKAQILRVECADITAEVLAKIETLHDDDLESVLICKYVNFLTLEKTAELLHYHPNTVKQKIKKAIEKLCTKMS